MAKDRWFPHDRVTEYVAGVVGILALVITPKPPLTGSAKDGLIFIAIAPAALEILASLRTGVKFSRIFRRYTAAILSGLQGCYGILSLWAIYRWNLEPSANYYEPYISLMAALTLALGVLRRAVGARASQGLSTP